MLKVVLPAKHLDEVTRIQSLARILVSLYYVVDLNAKAVGSNRYAGSVAEPEFPSTDKAHIIPVEFTLSRQSQALLPIIGNHFFEHRLSLSFRSRCRRL